MIKLEKYFFGLAICFTVFGVLGALWGFFGALMVGIPWSIFWVSLGVIMVSAPVIYALGDDD